MHKLNDLRSNWVAPIKRPTPGFRQLKSEKTPDFEKGDRCNDWTIIHGPFRSTARQLAYFCECSCGWQQSVNKYSLLKNKSKSCKKCAYAKKTNNIPVDTVFGNLIVISDTHALFDTVGGYRRAKVLCRCVCGNKEFANKGGLLEGKKKSCSLCSYLPAEFRKNNSVDFLFNKEAASFLGFSSNYLTKLARKHKVPAYKNPHSNELFYNKNDLISLKKELDGEAVRKNPKSTHKLPRQKEYIPGFLSRVEASKFLGCTYSKLRNLEKKLFIESKRLPYGTRFRYFYKKEDLILLKSAIRE